MSDHGRADNPTVLITGAGGFLGSELVRQALDRGIQVRATDRMPQLDVTGVDYQPADILDPDNLPPLMQGIDCVIHLAGLAHIFDSRQQAAAPFKQVNEMGTGNVARAAAEAGVGRLVLASSVSVYGPFTQGSYNETKPCAPLGPYAESKYQAEQRAQEVADGTGMQLTILRLATLYGEGDPGNVGRLIRTIDRGRFVWVGSGTNRKSLIHFQDAARAFLSPVISSAPVPAGAIYNVSAPTCTMREVVEQIALSLNQSLPRWHIPGGPALFLGGLAARLTGGRGRFADLDMSLRKWLANDAYDSTRFRDTFGFETEIDLAEGISREVDWYRRS